MLITSFTGVSIALSFENLTQLRERVLQQENGSETEKGRRQIPQHNSRHRITLAEDLQNVDTPAAHNILVFGEKACTFLIYRWFNRKVNQ